VDDVQAARGDSPLDRPPGRSGRHKLATGNDAVLPGGEPCDRPVEAVVPPLRPINPLCIVASAVASGFAWNGRVNRLAVVSSRVASGFAWYRRVNRLGAAWS
jgi:hypothetical protein